MTTFDPVLVSRVPALAGTPILTVVDRLVVDNISYTTELNRPGSATLSCPVRGLSSTAQGRLNDLKAFPSEVWIYVDSTLAWAGEVQTWQVQGQTLNINCVGLLGYTFRMGVTSDLTYTTIDQFTIAKGLVDHWQALNYGNYGIDTSTVGTSGVTRDRTYLRNELHNIGQRLQELGAVSNGFDIKVDPSTRKLVLTNPQQGTDLSASIVFDNRNIDNASVSVSVAPDDLVSDVAATSTATDTAGNNTTLYSIRTTAGVQSSFGRGWAGISFSDVSAQTTLDGHADAYLNARASAMVQPGITIIPRVGADIGGFNVGDTCAYSYDCGVGVQTLTPRLAKVTVTIDSSGEKRMRLDFV